MWLLLIASGSFGMYKNFTAIDKHTIHENEIIQLELNDTNGIENFVKNFTKTYLFLGNKKKPLSKDRKSKDLSHKGFTGLKRRYS